MQIAQWFSLSIYLHKNWQNFFFAHKNCEWLNTRRKNNVEGAMHDDGHLSYSPIRAIAFSAAKSL